MFRRIPQPPVNAAARDPEKTEFWPGFVVTVVGLVLLICGASRLTALPTVDGETAREVQLIKAFSSGGVVFKKPSETPPPQMDDPAAAAEALDRWARENEANSRIVQVLIDTGAKTPCPT
jgi:hypothetical protein